MRPHQLMQYTLENGPFSVKQVQQRGACMFSASWRCINCPFEWTNTHLHWQVVAHIVHNIEFLYPIISTHIQGNYGHLRITQEEYDTKKRLGTLTPEEKEDFEAPDPFSLVTYLKALIKRKFYGDIIILIIISMMWQVQISVLNAETLRQIKIQTSTRLNKVNIALVHCQYNHYVLLGKHCNLSVWCHNLSRVHHDLFGRHCNLFSSHEVQYMYFLLVGTVIYTYSATIYLISTMIYLIGAVLYIIPVLQFDAEDEEGNVSTHDSMLSVEPVKHTETYSLGDEHWSIYSDGSDEDRFILIREWPNVQLPQRPLPSEPEPAPPAMPSGLVEKLMQQHHTNVDILLSLGKDPCKEYKLSKAPAVLARVWAGNKTCTICNRVLASTQSHPECSHG